jgi:hypothetical protein
MTPEKKHVRDLEDHLAELAVQTSLTAQALVEARKAAGMVILTGFPPISRGEDGKGHITRRQPPKRINP